MVYEMKNEKSGPQVEAFALGSDTLISTPQLRAVPKVELHLHLEGSISPERIIEFHERAGSKPPTDDPAAIRRLYTYKNFQDFSRTLLLGVASLRRPEDFYDVVMDIGQQLYEHNTAYAEITWTPQFYLNRKVPLIEILAAMNAARSHWREKAQLEMRWIPDLIRSRPAPASQIVKWACDPRIREMGVVALGLGGPEAGYPATNFAEVFRYANERGLPGNPHAGEGGPANSVRDAIDALNPVRIGHGVSAASDPEVVNHVLGNRTALEICLTSNLSLGVVSSLDRHPLRALLNAGVEVTINTDDPVLFQTDITKEYALAIGQCGLTFEELLRTIRTAIDVSYADTEIKVNLHRKLAQYVATL